MTTAARPSALVLIAWATVALGIVWLVALGGGFYGIYGSEIRVVSVVLSAAALGAWGVAALRNPSWRPHSTIWPALALPLATFAVTTLTSERPRISAEYLAYAVLLAALYLLLRALLAHSAFRDRVTGFSVILALGIGIAYVAACFGRWVDWWNAVGALRLPPLRPYFESLTFGNPSAVLTMSVLLTAAAVAHLGLATRGRQAAVGGLVALAAIVTLLSGSRSGWLAVGIAVLVVGAAALVSSAGRRALAGLLRTRFARLAALGAVVLGAGVVIILAPGILFRTGSGGEDLRSTYIAVASRMFAQAPLTGVGAGDWVAGRIGATAASESDYYIPHAHNLYTQTAAEHGILGLLAGAIAIGCLAWLILGGLRDPDGTRRRWAWAAFFASVYFGAHQLLDFYANMPAALFAYVIPIAWLDATAPRSITARLRTRATVPRARPGIRRAVTVLGVGLLSVSIVALIAQEAPAATMSDGRVAADRGDWNAALPFFRAARTADPEMPPYAFALGLAEARDGNTLAALADLQSVATTDDLPVAWLDVAALRATTGDTAGAREAVDRSLRLGRQQPAVAFAAGALLEQLGDTTAADAAWTQAVSALPRLAGDPWWQDPVRAGRWPAIRDAALADMLPEDAADLWLSQGNAGRASVAATEIKDAAARRRTELAIAAWDGGTAERDALAAYAQQHPLDLVAVAWAGRVAARVGDLPAVERYRLWADTVNGGASGAVGEYRVTASDPPAGDVIGLNGTFWGQYTYRRATPRDQLVPGLQRLVIVPGS